MLRMPIIRIKTQRQWRIAALLAMILFLGASRGYAAGQDFSVVVLPDPQHYASKYTKIGIAQTKWICQNREKLHIDFVVSVGDNVDSGYKDAEFKRSVRFMKKLNGVVPYGVACGNHDLKDGKKGSYTSRKFVDYYGPQRFKKFSWYGGASPSGFSSFQTFSGGGLKFLAIELAVAATKAEIEWARKVMADHSGTPVILTTHQMLGPKGKLGKGTAANAPDHQTPKLVWEQLIEPSPQIFLVLCGHYHGESHITKKTQAAQPVHVVLQDYQNEPNGGNGWLRIFTFHPQQNRVDVQTYSPTLNQYRKGEESEFSLAVDFKQLAGSTLAKR
jgi:hypothetical protein